jgi:hypothetical protein
MRRNPWQQKISRCGGKHQPTSDEQHHVTTGVGLGRRSVRGNPNAIRSNVERPRKHERYRKSHQQTHN